MMTERQDRRYKQLIREEEKKEGRVAIHCICMKPSDAHPLSNRRIVRIGTSADPASNIKLGQSWNPARFEILTVLWAPDRAQAQRVYKRLHSAFQGQREETGDMVGPWFDLPFYAGMVSDAVAMEFAIRDVAREVGVGLLTEMEYEAVILRRVEGRLSRGVRCCF